MKEFMLIFRHDNSHKTADPEELKIWMQQAVDWIGGITAQNKCVGGSGLSFDEARVVHANKTMTNGPFGDIKETLGGYVIVKAESVDEAVAFAKDCPVLEGEGNTVEVRQIARGEDHLPEAGK